MTAPRRTSVSGWLVAVIVVLAVQTVICGLAGIAGIAALNEYAGRGGTAAGGGVAYSLTFSLVAVAVLLLLCIVFTFRPQEWVRPVLIAIETVVIIGAVFTVILGVTAVRLLLIAVPFFVVAVLMSEDAKAWYRR
jgi:hypothetical protein